MPTFEPRGAIAIDLAAPGHALRIVSMHLDLSGIRRRQQVRAIMHHLGRRAEHRATILMGDLNEWSPAGGALREFGAGYTVLAPGPSFHTRRAIAGLDRIIVSAGITMRACGVHRSALAARASDHLPVWARLSIDR